MTAIEAGDDWEEVIEPAGGGGGGNGGNGGDDKDKKKKVKIKYSFKFKPDFKPKFKLSEALPKVSVTQAVTFKKGNMKNKLKLTLDVTDPFNATATAVAGKLAWDMDAGNGFTAGASVKSKVIGVASPTDDPTLKSVLIEAYAKYEDKKGLKTGVFFSVNTPFKKDKSSGKVKPGAMTYTINPYLTKSFRNKQTKISLKSKFKVIDDKVVVKFEYKVDFKFEHRFNKNTALVVDLGLNGMNDYTNPDKNSLSSSAMLGLTTKLGKDFDLSFNAGVITNHMAKPGVPAVSGGFNFKLTYRFP